MIQYNGLTLAYIGDALFELSVRKHLLDMNLTKVNDLHKNAIRYTSAVAQANIASVLLEDFFTDDEVSIYKRGRNQSSTHKPKNADVQTYNMATGFEAVIGYTYIMEDHKRLSEILNRAFKVIEEL